MLDSHDIIGMREKVVGHCVGYKYKMLLLVVVRNEVE